MPSICQLFEEHLDSYVAETLAVPLQQQLQGHLEECQQCAGLLAIVLAEPGDDRQSDDFVTPVLQTTSGSSCARSQSLLGDFIDDGLSHLDTSLVQSHLQHCATCCGIQQALLALRIDLPGMAQHAPDVGFVQGVLAATSMARPPAPSRIERWTEIWNSLLQRPRFAWEVAWLGTAVLLLLVGSPRSPWHEVPQTALAIVQTNPATVYRAAQPHAQRAWAWVADDIDAAWDASGGRLIEATQQSGEQWNAEHPLAVSSWQSVRARLALLQQAVGDGNLAQASYVLNDLGGDIQNLWHGIRAIEQQTTGSPTPPDREEN